MLGNNAYCASVEAGLPCPQRGGSLTPPRSSRLLMSKGPSPEPPGPSSHEQNAGQTWASLQSIWLPCTERFTQTLVSGDGQSPLLVEIVEAGNGRGGLKRWQKARWEVQWRREQWRWRPPRASAGHEGSQVGAFCLVQGWDEGRKRLLGALLTTSPTGARATCHVHWLCPSAVPVGTTTQPSP